MAVDSHPEVEQTPGSGEQPARAWTAVEVLTGYLGEQLAKLQREDPPVRAGVPDSVHRMRVAARRARSALATYSPLLEPGSCSELIANLRWLGMVLGEARDADVLGDRMDALLNEQPDSFARGHVSRRIGALLEERGARGRAHASELLDSSRYASLLAELDELVTSPPVTPDSAVRGSEEVARLVHQDWKRLRRRARLAAGTAGREERDRALHDVRKAAKRLRYAAESAVPALGRRAEALTVSCATLQDTLGEHQDSVVARGLLRSVHDDVAGSGARDPALDRLHAREEQRAEAMEKEYEAALDLLMRTHPAGWLRHASQGAEPPSEGGRRRA